MIAAYQRRHFLKRSHQTAQMNTFGYHGTTRANAVDLLNNGFKPSASFGDWLGRGIYFWQDAPQRAAAWAARRCGVDVDDIAVIRAQISLDNCLDLFDLQTYHELRRVYQQFVALEESQGFSWRQAELVVQSGRAFHAGASAEQANILNCRDRALIDWYTEFLKSEGLTIRSVRGVFLYGTAIFRQSFLFDWSHAQIAVIDPKAISNPKRIDF